MPRKSAKSNASGPGRRRAMGKPKPPKHDSLPGTPPSTGGHTASGFAPSWTIYVGTSGSNETADGFPTGAEANLHSMLQSPEAKSEESDPQSAWIVFGSDDSLPIAREAAVDGEEFKWTANQNVAVGDTLFFYFISPEKAIHSIARVTSPPVLGKPLLTRPSGPSQWRVDCDSMVCINPIPLSEIRRLFREDRYLTYFKGARYIRPDHANLLLTTARISIAASPQIAARTLRRVTGRHELGEPSAIDLPGLRGIEASAFRCEDEVEYYLLEPLLRLAEVDQYQRRYDLPSAERKKQKTADYVVMDGPKVRSIIEVKLDLQEGSDDAEGQDFDQVREYVQMSGARSFVLFDRQRLVGYRADQDTPRFVFERANLDKGELGRLRDHVLGQ